MYRVIILYYIKRYCVGNTKIYRPTSLRRKQRSRRENVYSSLLHQHLIRRLYSPYTCNDMYNLNGKTSKTVSRYRRLCGSQSYYKTAAFFQNRFSFTGRKYLFVIQRKVPPRLFDDDNSVMRSQRFITRNLTVNTAAAYNFSEIRSVCHVNLTIFFLFEIRMTFMFLPSRSGSCPRGLLFSSGGFSDATKCVTNSGF